MEPNEERLTTEEVTAKTAPRRSHVDWFVVFLAVVLGLMLASPFALRSWRYMQGSSVLAHAKTARLAAKTVSLECYGAGVTFADQTTESGFTESALDEIVLLARSPGEVFLRRVGSNGYDILAMEYTEGSYTVLYDAEKGQWTVRYFQAILNPQPVRAHDD